MYTNTRPAKRNAPLRTLNDHRWFKAQTSIYPVVKTSSLLDTNLIITLVIVILSNLNSHLHLRFTLSLLYITFVVMYMAPIKQKEPTLYMRFTRPSICYKNTHYIFEGTRTELQWALEKLQKELALIKTDPYFGESDHDDLLDTPLDTFCNSKCHCLHDKKNENNYKCSHWELYSYKTRAELNESIGNIKLIQNCFPNEMNFI